MAELRDLPGVDALLAAPGFEQLAETFGTQSVKDVIRTIQAEIRERGSVPSWAVSQGGWHDAVDARLAPAAYRPVFNLTGTIIHTNLGRALISDRLWEDIRPLVTRPLNLEYDINQGQRGDRDFVIESRLRRLIGCEAATVVNNNAAALMLVLNTLALGQRVPVSRGELIEIGGSFRLPALMSRSGCELIEVGTTNRTHLSDFAQVAADAAMLLKVHPSNYHIDGFTADVSAQAIADLAQQHEIPSCVDLGSGTLVDLSRWGLPKEPTPQSVLADGIDLVTFSGDKLLGGVQAGIIVGNQQLMDQIKSNPMKRALRADKITMAALDATLKLYEEPQQLAEHLPLLRVLTVSDATLKSRARKLCKVFSPAWESTIEPSPAQIGSGALPDKTIQSIAITLQHPNFSADKIADMLRNLTTPVIARVHDDKVWLDMRGAELLAELSTTLAEMPS